MKKKIVAELGGSDLFQIYVDPNKILPENQYIRRTYLLIFPLYHKSGGAMVLGKTSSSGVSY